MEGCFTLVQKFENYSIFGNVCTTLNAEKKNVAIVCQASWNYVSRKYCGVVRFGGQTQCIIMFLHLASQIFIQKNTISPHWIWKVTNNDNNTENCPGSDEVRRYRDSGDSGGHGHWAGGGPRHWLPHRLQHQILHQALNAPLPPPPPPSLPHPPPSPTPSLAWILNNTWNISFLTKFVFLSIKLGLQSSQGSMTGPDL